MLMSECCVCLHYRTLPFGYNDCLMGGDSVQAHNLKDQGKNHLFNRPIMRN